MKIRNRWAAGALLVSTMLLVYPPFGRADAPPGRYVVQNGTVLDTETGLTWQQAVPAELYLWGGPGCVGCSFASVYCAGLALDGGGWRLPTMRELQTLVDETKSDPAIDTNYFPGTPAEAFWTSSPGLEQQFTWVVNFGAGNSGRDVATQQRRVRCVR